jgi:hypothetical protein
MICQPLRHLCRKCGDFAPIFNDFSPKVCGKSRALFINPRKASAPRPDNPLGRRNVGHNLTTSLRELARTFARAFDPYRPELYYMRGPGPKWHAKWTDHPTQGPATALVDTLTEAAAARA